jgi:aspartyl/asparaginyl-tRNA synthetase
VEKLYNPATVEEVRPMRRTRVVDALGSQAAVEHILVKGWVRTRRDAKGLSFLEINDGSGLHNLQVIVDETSPAYASLKQVMTGAAVEVEGALIASLGKGQQWEVRATSLQVLGTADPETYPLQKKRHTDEFLRTIAHLRPRTNKYGALFRIRSESALPCISSSGSGVFIIYIRPLSPGRIARALARCFVSPPCHSGAATARLTT